MRQIRDITIGFLLVFMMLGGLVSCLMNANGVAKMDRDEVVLIKNEDSPTLSYKRVDAAPDRMGAEEGGEIDDESVLDALYDMTDEAYTSARKALLVLMFVGLFMAMGSGGLLVYINELYRGIPA